MQMEEVSFQLHLQKILIITLGLASWAGQFKEFSLGQILQM